MKPAKERRAQFSESSVRRLNAYALAAGAAGVGLLAATPSNAEVVYTPVEVSVSLSGPDFYYLNPAGAQVAPFTFYAGFTSPNFYWDTLSFNPGTAGARFVQGPGTSWSIAPLKNGFVIGPTRRFGSPYRGFVATYGPYGGGTYNQHDGFKFGQLTYIGFKFLIGGQTHFGWARVTVHFNRSTPKRRLHLEITGYAYETTPNTSIKAGQTSGTPATPSKDSVGPQSALPTQSLGLLALGAEGMAAWRRE